MGATTTAGCLALESARHREATMNMAEGMMEKKTCSKRRLKSNCVSLTWNKPWLADSAKDIVLWVVESLRLVGLEPAPSRTGKDMKKEKMKIKRKRNERQKYTKKPLAKDTQARSFVEPDPSIFEYSLHIEAIFV